MQLALLNEITLNKNDVEEDELFQRPVSKNNSRYCGQIKGADNHMAWRITPNYTESNRF